MTTAPDAAPPATAGPDPLGIDRLVHEPARMAILSVLDGVTDAEFVFLQRAWA